MHLNWFSFYSVFRGRLFPGELPRPWCLHLLAILVVHAERMFERTRLYNVKVLVVSGFTALAFLVMNWVPPNIKNRSICRCMGVCKLLRQSKSPSLPFKICRSCFSLQLPKNFPMPKLMVGKQWWILDWRLGWEQSGCCQFHWEWPDFWDQKILFDS